MVKSEKDRYEEAKKHIEFQKENTKEEIEMLDVVYNNLIKKGYTPANANSIISTHIFNKIITIEKMNWKIQKKIKDK